MAKVRGAMVRTKIAILGLCTLAVLLGAGSMTPRADAAELPASQTRITVALLPNGLDPDRLWSIDGISPGVYSAGMGGVTPDQTYLDITQGSRVFGSLYKYELPLVLPRGDVVPNWDRIVRRADSAPVDIVPGLLASVVNTVPVAGRDRVAMEAEPDLVYPSILAADRDGRIGRMPVGCRKRGCMPVVRVQNADPADLPAIIAKLSGNDMMIAIERSPPPPSRSLAMGIAGAGFSGNLTSDTTRIDGFVLSTDIAPTIITRLGLEIPDQMTGEQIRSEGAPDAAAVASLADRLSIVGMRRSPVIGVSALVWILLTGLVAALSRGRLARPAVQMLAVSVALLPLILMFTAALRPSLDAERLIVALGTPILAAILLRFVGGWRALSVACMATVLGVACDLIAGSPLTGLSLLGPSPGLGVRFYGIGNELAGILVVVLLMGIGSGIAGFRPQLSPRRSAIVFLFVTIPLAAIFASGHFGADVGSALVFPAVAVVAAALVAGRPKLALIAFVVPIIALALLAAGDLVTGGNSHFIRSFVHGSGDTNIFDVVIRRLHLAGRSFVRGAGGMIMPLTVVVIGLGIAYRKRIAAWLEPVPAVRAAYVAGIVAALLGTAANDSGVLLLEVGSAFLLVFTGFSWAQSPKGGPNR